ncbi:hypothetical protein BDY21DRAFT_157036 [Lineolata rhizophorae]|uniref:DUF7924 domain-containing protein n=1 Tax=Lineolata rhizophorae TaxID=578093 RepID=A0A6A6NLQ0_9PEZI|nr:hypothetical protein BDY21DRAFT_157036 [Lineolata rhizophorae]
MVPDMNGGVSEAQTRGSCRKLSKALRGKHLDAVASTGAELPQSHRDLLPLNGDLSQITTPEQARKRQLDETSESDPLPAKRIRLTPPNSREPRVDDREKEEANKTTLQHPKTKRPYVPLLKDFVEPVSPGPRSEPIYAFVSEWLESVETRSQSDSHHHRSNTNFVPRYFTRSAPEMVYTRDADGFAVPPTPDSCARTATPSDLDSGRLSSRSLVEDPLYRPMNLAANHIYMRNPDEEFPEYVAGLVRDVGKDRDSPGPSPDQLRHNADLYGLENGAGEPEVEEYFRDEIFPKSRASDSLKRTHRQLMAKHAVRPTGSKLKVSTPMPDMLYGYNRNAFLQQQPQLISMGTEMVANNQDLIYPFFVIEFKGDGGSMWVATNQCLGGSTSCVNIAERLNRQLRQCTNEEIRPTNSAAFSIAMNGTEARLYISWKHNELDYYMRKVRSFLLQEPGIT